jgi:hypothetical protein
MAPEYREAHQDNLQQGLSCKGFEIAEAYEVR